MPPVNPNPQALLVLGMHRSGTSALTGLLGILGAQMPLRQIGAGAQNAKGFFEAKPIARLNDRLLALHDRTWDNWLPMQPVDPKETPELLSEAKALLQEEFGTSDVMALKDPRICRLAPFWTKALQESGRQVTYILPLRQPMEVAESLRVRNGFELHKGLLLWLTYVLEAEAATRGKPRLFTDFEQLLSDPSEVIKKIKTHLPQIPLKPDHEVSDAISEFLQPELKHQKNAETQGLPDKISDVFHIFKGWVQSGENQTDYTILDRNRKRIAHIASSVESDDIAFQSLSYFNVEFASKMPQLPSKNMTKADILRQFDALRTTNATLHAELDATQVTSQRQAGELRQLSLRNQTRDQELAALGTLLLQTESKLAQSEKNASKFAKQVAELSKQHNTLDNTHHTLARQHRHTSSENTELHALVARVENERARLATKNDELHALVARVENERHAIASSTFWRATSPFRRVINWFR